MVAGVDEAERRGWERGADREEGCEVLNRQISRDGHGKCCGGCQLRK